MKVSIVLLALVLSACTTIQRQPATVIIPKIEESWLEDLGDLKKLEDRSASGNPPKLEDVSEVINENYSKYHILRSNMKAIRDYIEKLKQIEGTSYGEYTSKKD